MAELIPVLVTGGAGFIGSAVCRHLVGTGRYRVVNVDKLTYSATLESLRAIETDPRYRFAQLDIGDEAGIGELLRAERIRIVMHLAAPTTTGRSTSLRS